METNKTNVINYTESKETMIYKHFATQDDQLDEINKKMDELEERIKKLEESK
jgi:ubiquinone biosynthesis protein UbiJ